MKDERGDDVPDNESNEWEVGRELMCSSRGDVFAVSQELRYLPMYVICRWCGLFSTARFVCRYWPSYFIARSRVQEKVCCFRFKYFHAESSDRMHERCSLHGSFATIKPFAKCNKCGRPRRKCSTYTRQDVSLKVTPQDNCSCHACLTFFE